MKKIFFVTLSLSFCLLLFFKACRVEEKLYYISEARMYIKLQRNSLDKYATIYFSHNPNGPFSEQYDYLLVLANIPTNIIVNSYENDKLIIPSDEIGIVNIHQRLFSIQRLKSELSDTTIYKKRIGTEPRIIKSPYYGITITENIEYMSKKRPGEDFFTKIKELK